VVDVGALRTLAWNLLHPGQVTMDGTRSALGVPALRQSEPQDESLTSFFRICSECQLACIVAAETCLRNPDITLPTDLVRSCHACIDASKALVDLLNRARPAPAGELRNLWEDCMNAAAACEAQCLGRAETGSTIRSCAVACAELQNACLRALQRQFA
jgi:hypothetical protein